MCYHALHRPCCSYGAWAQTGWLVSPSRRVTSHFRLACRSLGPRLQTNTHCHDEDRLFLLPHSLEATWLLAFLPLWLKVPSGNLTFGFVVANLHSCLPVSPFCCHCLLLIPPWVLLSRLGHACLNSVLSPVCQQTTPNPPFPLM